MRRYLPILSGLALLLLGGLVHGVWTGRWGGSEALNAAAARVDSVPLAVGEWQGKSLAADAEAFAQAGARSYWVRQYANERTQGTVTALLMCGAWGKIAVHTPEICYQGAGYDMVSEPVRQRVDVQGGPPAEFWTARFRKPGPGGATALRIFWGWGAGENWSAPDRPRWTFAGSPFLYKLYIVRDVTDDTAADELARSLEFLPAFLPEVRKALSPSPMLPGEKL
jgi:hypothetical protein